MPVRTTTQGKVFEDIPGLGQGNEPTDNPNYSKFGRQSVNIEKLKSVQINNRTKAKFKIPKSK